MTGIFPSVVSLGGFSSAVVTVNQTAFVLSFKNLLTEATATYRISVSKIVSYNDGLIPAIANTTPAGLSSFVVFFAVNYKQSARSFSKHANKFRQSVLI